MSLKRQNTVGFDIIFVYAAEKFGVIHNRANKMFFESEIFTYKGYDNLSRAELRWDLKELEKENKSEDAERILALKILISYMHRNHIRDLLVLCN